MGNQPNSSRHMLRDHYSSMKRESAGHHASHTTKNAESFDYSMDELPTVPEDIILGASDENTPVEAGQETRGVLFDLGSSAGLELFQNACKVSTGEPPIEVEMSNDMAIRARLDTTKAAISNVKINPAPATEIYMESESIDCVISDCVINRLEPNKKKLLFDEVFRLLTSRKTLLSRDQMTKTAIPNELRKSLGTYVGCISGVKLVSGTTSWLKEADFQGTVSVFTKKEIKTVRETPLTPQIPRTDKTNLYPPQNPSPQASRAHHKMTGSCKIRRRRSMRLVSTSGSARPAFLLLSQTSSVMYRNASE